MPLDNNILPEFHLPTEIFIKQSISNNTPEIVSKYGKRAIFITTTSDFEVYSESLLNIYNSLKSAGIGCIIYDELSPSPNTEEIDEAVSFAKKTKSDVIIGFGGVNSLNSAKIISLLASNYMFAYDIFSVDKLPQPPVNLITMPAYPSFGFEISPVFYIKDIHDLNLKVYYNLDLYPKATITDPELSLLSSEIKILKTSISSMALATESVISTQNNDIINTYALKAIDLIFRNLPVAYKEPQNIVPRVYLSTASIMSGISFSVSFLSVSLALALAIASKTEIDVDTAVAMIIPHIMEYNLTTSPGKYVQMSKVMGEEVHDITVIEAAIKAVEAVRKLETDLDIPQRLSQFKVSQNQFRGIAELASTYPFIQNTPRPLSVSELETVLIAAF